jgi:hypothetical protein
MGTMQVSVQSKHHMMPLGCMQPCLQALLGMTGSSWSSWTSVSCNRNAMPLACLKLAVFC